MNVLKYNIPAILFGLLAAWLIMLGKEGWGWFVFLALVSLHFVSTERNTD